MNNEIKKRFEEVYKIKKWGKGYRGIEFDYFSGMGSTPNDIITTELYIKNFCEKFDKELSISDLGCGAFEVGERIRKYFGKYDAYDVVEGLIERNKKLYKNFNVDFYFADVCEDFIEKNDVALIRHVVQHLNNDSLHKLVKNIQDKFNYIILIQDYYSLEEGKIAKFNRSDIPIGASRCMHSLVCLNESPYNLKCLELDQKCVFLETEINPDNNKCYYQYRLFQTYKLK